MMEVPPLSPHLLVLAAEQSCGFVPPLTALLPAREPFLSFGKLLLAFAIVPRIRDGRALSRDAKHLQAHVDARLAPCGRHRLSGHPGTGEGDIPAVRLPTERDYLGGARRRAAPAYRQPANLGE